MLKTTLGDITGDFRDRFKETMKPPLTAENSKQQFYRPVIEYTGKKDPYYRSNWFDLDKPFSERNPNASPVPNTSAYLPSVKFGDYNAPDGKIKFGDKWKNKVPSHFHVNILDMFNRQGR